MNGPTDTQLRKLIGVANYQLGSGTGEALFRGQIKLVCSRRTGRIRHVFKNKKLIATLRPTDGCLALTTHGASILLSRMKKPPNLVIVATDVSGFIQRGGDVFARHVVRADQQLHPMEEAIVCDEDGVLLGVGRTVLSGKDMNYFKRGVAVKIRGSVLLGESLTPDPHGSPQSIERHDCYENGRSSDSDN